MKWITNLSIVLLALVAYQCYGEDRIRVMNLQTNDIIYDWSRGMIYASIPGSVQQIGNTVTGIDPMSESLVFSTFMGSEPRPLAIARDFSYLYTGLFGSNHVARMHLPTRSRDLLISLGISGGGTGPRFAEDIAVMPGSPRTIAVSLRNQGYSPRHEGVAVFDDNVKRPNETRRHTGSNQIEFGDNSWRLYGQNTESTEYGFRRLIVDEDGVREQDVTQNLLTGFNVEFEYAAGRIFSSSGRVIDPEERVLLGTYSAVGSVEPDPFHNRVFFLTGSGSTRTLAAFEMDTFRLLDTLQVNGVNGTATSLIRWGGNGLAFRTTAGQLFLINSSIVPEPATWTALLAGLGAFLAARRRTRS